MYQAKYYIIVLCLIVIGSSSKAQVSMDFSGYVSSLQSAQFIDFEENWNAENFLHNRLKFNVYFGEHLTLNAEVRNRMFWKNVETEGARFTDRVSGQSEWADMDHIWVDGTSVLLHSKVDRLALEMNAGKFNLKVGRQRINWGRTYVWNCNDIFNSYSFFDFDYVEKPGSDAARLIYYFGMASQLETAVKVNAEGKMTAAGYALFNVKGYDIQFFGALVDEREYAFGAGWAGDLWKMGFKGEATYLLPKEEFESTYDKSLLVSAGLEYMFENQLMIRSEYLYNEAAPEIGDLTTLLLTENSVRNLSFSKNNVFLGMDYPITPLLTTSVSGMWMSELDGFFAGPTLTYSLKDNLDFSLVGQYFNMKPDGGERFSVVLGFLKLQYSF